MDAAEAAGGGVLDEQAAASAPMARIPKYFIGFFLQRALLRCARPDIGSNSSVRRLSAITGPISMLRGSAAPTHEHV